MMSTGFSASAAGAIQGGAAVLTVPAGSNLATATVLQSAVAYSNVGGGGVALPPWAEAGDQFMIANHAGSSFNIYPPNANAGFNGGSAGAAAVLAAGACAFIRIMTPTIISLIRG